MMDDWDEGIEVPRELECFCQPCRDTIPFVHEYR